MTTFPELQPLCDKVKEVYGEDAIVTLFGSRSRGDHCEWSDYDVMIISENLGSSITEVRRTVKQLNVDLHCVNKPEYEVRLGLWKKSQLKRKPSKKYASRINLHIAAAALDGICLLGEEHFNVFRQMRDDWVTAGEIIDPALQRFVALDDGLAASQRCVLNSMPNSKARRIKSARIVGDAAHSGYGGSTFLYGVLLRMSQPWSVKYPLVDFQGNRGNQDGAAPAAMRYTEARRSKCQEFDDEPLSILPPELLRQLAQDVESLAMQEDVTPSRVQEMVTQLISGKDKPLSNKFPTLLANGVLGFTAIDSKFPAFDLDCVASALLLTLEKPNVSDEELLDTIGMPVFPTGGILLNPDEALATIKAGTGTIKLSSRLAVNEDDRVITIVELPFGVAGYDLEEELVRAVKAKTLPGVKSVKNHSSFNEVGIELALKARADIDETSAAIMSLPSMESEIEIDLRAIRDGEIFQVTIPELIRHHVEMRLGENEGNKDETQAEFNRLKQLAS